MSNDPTALQSARERTIARLSRHFTEDALEPAEYERRVTAAHLAETGGALEALTADLPALHLPAVVPATALVPADEIRDRRTVVSVFGNNTRAGTWQCPRQLKAVAVFGNITLDFRDAAFAPGTTEVTVRAVFGNIEIYVPPTLPVEIGGTAVFGNFEHLERAPTSADPTRPLLRVHGTAVFGNVEVHTRPPQGGAK